MHTRHISCNVCKPEFIRKCTNLWRSSYENIYGNGDDIKDALEQKKGGIKKDRIFSFEEKYLQKNISKQCLFTAIKLNV